MGASNPALNQAVKHSNAFVHPRRGFIPVLCNSLANSKLWAACRRAILNKLPFVKLESDVTDVVYLSWLVPINKVRAHIPVGVTVLERDGYTILTLLSYRHGNFGPVAFGNVRRLFPSPLQSNWRLYVTHVHGKPVQQNTVLFLKNVFSTTFYAMGSRLFSDVLPSHLAADFQHECLDGHYSTRIRAGNGSAPEFEGHLYPAEEKALKPEFKNFFAGWQNALKTICLQDEALCALEHSSNLASAGIELPIDLDMVQALKVQRVSVGAYLQALGVIGDPFCFAVSEVKFKVLWERLI